MIRAYARATNSDARRVDRRRSHGLALALLAAAALVAGLLVSPAAAGPERTVTAVGLDDDGARATSSPGPGRTPSGADYRLDLRTNTTGDQWRGRQEVTFTNTSATELSRVWLRLWGNGVNGCATADPVRVSAVTGGTAGPLAVDCTALPVDLPRPLTPGAEAVISFDLAIDVPYGKQRFGRVGDFSYLGNAVPVLAVRDSDGWQLPPYVPKGGSFGESFFSLTADWTVAIDHPNALAVPATGSVISAETSGDRTKTTVRASDVRDFALAAGPFREVRSVTDTGVTVRGWLTPDVATDTGRTVAGTVADAIDSFSDRYGRYPYGELDAVISGAFDVLGGMEYPAFLFTEPVGSVAAHETAHQWWYGLVGNDEYHHPWLDESVTQYVTDKFLGRVRSCDPYAWPASTARVDADMGYFGTDYDAYTATVYQQGTCMLHDLEATLGAGPLRLALRAVQEQHTYGVVEPAEFKRVMQEHTPVDLSPLWQRWRNDRN